MADGWITIETKLATDKFDKQIAKLDEKIRKKEKQKMQLETDIKNIKESEKEYDKLAGEYEITSEKLKNLNNELKQLEAQRKKSTPGGIDYKISTNEIEALKPKIKEVETELAKGDKELTKWETKFIQNANKIEKIKAKQQELTLETKKYKNEIESVKLQKQQAQVEQLKKGFGKVGNSVDSAVKKIGRLALGIFSVASAYRLMSSASSTLGQYDEQYATNLEYIRYLIAQAIAPALKYVVNLASTLLSYLNYIAKAWFNVTLFSKNSAKNFAKAQGSTSKIKKDLQTTPFDEMNVLSDTSTSGAGGGVTAPSIDASMISGEVPEWLQWLGEHGAEIAMVIGLIGSALAGLKIANFLNDLGLLGKDLKNLDIIVKGLGIGLVIFGIIKLVKDLQDYLEKFDPLLEGNGTSFKDFGKIISDIGLIVLGFGMIFGGLPAIITGAIILILGIIMKYWEEIKGYLQKAQEWLNGLQDKIVEWFYKNIDKMSKEIGDFGIGVVAIFVGTFNWLVEIVKGAIELIINILDGLFTGFKQIFDGIIMICKGNFKQGLVSVFKGIANVLIGILNGLIAGINAILYPVRALIAGLGTVMGKSWTINTVKIPTIPKLKSGTILNNPGKGVPVAGGRAIAGEAGREAFLPLSDTQLLEELGSTIGRYITINANITNSMNGRVISRQLQRIQNDDDFAYNT